MNIQSHIDGDEQDGRGMVVVGEIITSEMAVVSIRNPNLMWDPEKRGIWVSGSFSILC